MRCDAARRRGRDRHGSRDELRAVALAGTPGEDRRFAVPREPQYQPADLQANFGDPRLAAAGAAV